MSSRIRMYIYIWSTNDKMNKENPIKNAGQHRHPRKTIPMIIMHPLHISLINDYTYLPWLKSVTLPQMWRLWHTCCRPLLLVTDPLHHYLTIRIVIVNVIFYCYCCLLLLLLLCLITSQFLSFRNSHWQTSSKYKISLPITLALTHCKTLFSFFWWYLQLPSMYILGNPNSLFPHFWRIQLFSPSLCC